MIALDTDVLVNWAMAGAPYHEVSRRFVDDVLDDETQVALVPQVLFEFLHVVTDPRRFEFPFAFPDAVQLVRRLWDGPEVVRVSSGPMLVHRTLELLDANRLGRKRILDSALAATLQEAGVRKLATFNRRDFEIYRFLEVIEPS